MDNSQQNNMQSIARVARSHLFMEAEVLSGDISARFYSKKTNKSLGVRTGTARRGWRVLKESDQRSVAIVNSVPYADHSEQRVIKPKTKKFLAIPVGPALTKAGVPRYSGPRDSSAPPLSFIPISNKLALLVGIKKGNKKKKDVFFVLKNEVKIPPRTRGVLPYVIKRGRGIATTLGEVLLNQMDILANVSVGTKR